MRIITLLLTTTFILGCSDFDRFYDGKRSPNNRENPEVVARVGSETITKEDLIKSLDDVNLKQRHLYLSSHEKLKDYLDSYINQTAIYKEAERRGFDKREDIRESLEMYKKRLLIQAIGQEIMSRRLSEEEIKKYYDENRAAFRQIKLSEIFIKSDPATGITKDAARTKAGDIVNRARLGEDFEKLARSFSDDPIMKRKRGNTGYISAAKFSAADGEKIFSLKENEISDPIETENGFYIVKVLESGKVIPLDQAGSKIEVELKRRAFLDYTKKLRDRMGVEIYEDKLKELKPNDEAK